ncbi:DUF6972 family protein [Sorangium sp. So ce861]|uniref:eCIS core domain-containing protein n=1 Tax=Sorangium sp. So ce861 TaxID=3133323 RepID=UPI003F637A93
MRASAKLPPAAEPQKGASPLESGRARRTRRTTELDGALDARMREDIERRALRPVQAKAAVAHGYGDLIAAARAPAPRGSGATGMPAPARSSLVSPGAEPARSPVQAKCAACAAGGATCSACATEDEAIQAKERPGAPSPAAASVGVRAAATEGVRGASDPLPHLARLQPAFGRYDLTQVKARVGGDAARANARIGALAYTVGDRVAFGAAPDLRLAAHEAAHAIQQRGGVQLHDGVGHPGDPYERQADEVADAVVRGDSAEPLLARSVGPAAAPGSAGAAAPVQRLASTATRLFEPPPPPPRAARARRGAAGGRGAGGGARESQQSGSLRSAGQQEEAREATTEPVDATAAGAAGGDAGASQGAGGDAGASQGAGGGAGASQGAGGGAGASQGAGGGAGASQGAGGGQGVDAGAAPAARGGAGAAPAAGTGGATAPAAGTGGGAAAPGPAGGASAGQQACGGLNAECYRAEVEAPAEEPEEQPPEPQPTESKEAVGGDSPEAEETDDCPIEQAIGQQVQAAAAPAAGGGAPPEPQADAAPTTDAGAGGTAAPATATAAGASAAPGGAADATAAAEEQADAAARAPLDGAIAATEAQRGESIAAYDASASALADAQLNVRALRGDVAFAPEPGATAADAGRRAAASARAAEFFSVGARRIEEAITLALGDIPARLDAVAASLKGGIAAAVEEQKAAISAGIAQARGAAFAAAEGARAQVHAEHAATVAALDAETATAIASLEAVYDGALISVDGTETTTLDRVNQLYAAARAAHEALGPAVGDECVARGQEYIDAYEACKIGEPDSFWAGHLTDRRAEAQQKAARETAAGYKRSLTETAQKQAHEAMKGRKRDRCGVIATASRTRDTLETQIELLVSSLGSGRDLAVAQADATRDAMLASIDAALVSTLDRLDRHEHDQRQAANDAGYLQQVVLEQAAFSAAASLQGAVSGAIGTIQQTLAAVRDRFAAEAAPDPEVLDRILAQATGGLGDGLDGLIAQVERGAAAASSSLAEAGARGRLAVESVGRSAEEATGAISASLDASMASLSAGALSAFGQQRDQYAAQVQSTAASGVAGLEQAAAGFDAACAAITGQVEGALAESARLLEGSLRDAKAGLDCEIPRYAREAASREQPAWKQVVAVVLIIAVIVVVALVIGPAVIGAVGAAASALGAGAAAATIGTIVGGAIVGAATSATIQVINNWSSGQRLSEGVGRAALMGAIGGFIGAGAGAFIQHAVKSVALQLVANVAADAVLEVGTALVTGEFSWEALGMAVLMSAITGGFGEIPRIKRIQQGFMARGARVVPGQRARSFADALAPRAPDGEAEAPRRAEADAEAPRRTDADAETPPRAEAEAEAPRRTDAEAEAPRRTEADAEAPRRTEADAEAPRRTEADAEAPRRTEADAEAPRRAEADAEAPRPAEETDGPTGASAHKAEFHGAVERSLDGGHKLRVTPDGRVYRCSECALATHDVAYTQKRHTRSGSAVQRDLRRGRDAHVFNDDVDLAALERMVWTEGKFHGEVREHMRFTWESPVPIGKRVQNGRPDVDLYVVEIKVKMGSDGTWQYHLVPRTRHAETKLPPSTTSGSGDASPSLSGSAPTHIAEAPRVETDASPADTDVPSLEATTAPTARPTPVRDEAFVWDAIRSTADNHPNTELPTNFELDAGGASFWVHPNATKHMAKWITRGSPSPTQANWRTQMLLADFRAAVALAQTQGIELGTTIRVGDWELSFSQRPDDRLPAIIHAVFRGTL